MRIVSGFAVRQRAGQRFTNKGWNPPYGANKRPNGAKRIAAAQPVDLSLHDGLPSKHHVLDAQAACESYEQAISEAGGIDLQLLGLGHNGHIGFNEPCDEFPVRTHVVELTESTINANSRLFESIDQVPREAYTMGIGTIMKARAILVVASGVDKAQIVRDAFFGPVTPQVPASVLQLHPNVTVVVDAEAGSLL